MESFQSQGTPSPISEKHSVGSFHPWIKLFSETQKWTVLLSLPSWGSLFPGMDELAGPWPDQCPSRETSVSRVKLMADTTSTSCWSTFAQTAGLQARGTWWVQALPAGLRPWASSSRAVGWFQDEMQPGEHPPPSPQSVCPRGVQTKR